MASDQNGIRQKMASDQNGIGPKWYRTKMVLDQNGIGPKWRWTKMASVQNGIGPKRYRTKMESDQNGIGPKRYRTKMASDKNGIRPKWYGVKSLLNQKGLGSKRCRIKMDPTAAAEDTKRREFKSTLRGDRPLSYLSARTRGATRASVSRNRARKEAQTKTVDCSGHHGNLRRPRARPSGLCICSFPNLQPHRQTNNSGTSTSKSSCS
jgi:hypothetical protein